MSKDDFPEEVTKAINDALSKMGDTFGFRYVLSQLSDILEPFAEHSNNKNIRKFYILFGTYRGILENVLENELTANFRSKLKSPIQITDPNDSSKTINKDFSAQLKWLANGYSGLADFFGERTGDFYYQKAKEKLVPEYIDEVNLPIVANILVSSYNDCLPTLTDGISKMLLDISTSPDTNEALNRFWDHFLLLYQNLRQWHSID